ncbi:MAG: hypothetical protein JNM59_05080 [Hyphomonadaceae bacterium]|nr:hypothetical protein [Hyphomonadaceae bacterium]
MIAVLLGALITTSSVAIDEARACTPVRWPDNGRYVGGDLATQIAATAGTIQLVRARERHLLARFDNRVEYLQRFGEWPEERGIGAPRTRYRQVYLYVFDVVETLKGHDVFDDFHSRGPLRIAAYASEDERQPGAREWASRPWIDESLLSAPGIERIVGLPAPQPAEAPAACEPHVAVELGALYVVLRSETGRVYFRRDGGDEGGLPINVAFGRSTASFAIDAPAIARVSGAGDPYVTALRSALARRSARR